MMLRQSVVIRNELIDKEDEEEIFGNGELWDGMMGKLLEEKGYKKLGLGDCRDDWVVFGMDAG